MESTLKHHSPIQWSNAEMKECWWMQAGVVPYKLCDRDYDCDHCPFDQVLQGKPAKSSHDEESQGDAHECEVADSLFYHPAHVWARIEDGGAVRTGIDDLGQLVLGRAYSVKLPEPGDEVRQDANCWRFTHQGGVTRLVAPVSGTVKEVNTSLNEIPTLVNHDPYGKGWALLIEPDDLRGSLRRLLYGREVSDWHSQQLEKLYETASALPSNEFATIGVTMNDGGRLRDDFLSKITGEQRRRLIAAMFPLSSTTEAEINKAILLQ